METAMHIKPALLLISFAILLASGCKSDEEKAAEEAVKNMAEAGKQMEEASKKMADAAATGGQDIGAAMAAMGAAMGNANGKAIETVDFRELKALLPESLPGMARGEATGEKTAAMGMQISTAQGRYRSAEGSSISLKIADIGSMTGLAGMATYAWAATEYDRETGSGYEKTTTFEGRKAQEKYNTSSRSGELSVMVAGRFVVEADGNNVDMDAIKAALKQVDLGKLENMKASGVK